MKIFIPYAIVVAFLLSACGGGSSSTPTTQNTTPQPVAAIDTAQASLTALAQGLSNPGVAPTAYNFSAKQFFATLSDVGLSVIGIQKAYAQATSTCSNGSPSSLQTTDNDYAATHVYCRLTSSESTARTAIPKALATPRQILCLLSSLKFDGVDRPGNVAIVDSCFASAQLAGIKAAYPNGFPMTHLIGTSPASFAGVAQTGYDYGVEFEKTDNQNANSQKWRIAYTSDGSRIKTWTDQTGQTEGFETTYVETNRSTGLIRFEQVKVPNTSNASSRDMVHTQLYATVPVTAGAFTYAFPSNISFALARKAGSDNAIITTAKNTGTSVVVRSWNFNGGSWSENAAQKKCLVNSSSTPSVCANGLDIAVDTTKFTAFTPTYANDVAALAGITATFNARGMLTWAKPDVLN